MAETHDLFGGELHVYKRDDSPLWYCSTYLLGKNRRKSTKEESLGKAKEYAEDWYLELKGKARYGEIKGGKTFAVAAKQFLREIELLTAGERSPLYVPHHKFRLDAHLSPYFGNRSVLEITPGLVQEYKIHRQTSKLHPKTKEPLKPSRATLVQEIGTLRLVLKTAERQGWLPYLPNLSEPYRKSRKVAHRGWFSYDEYQSLYEETGQRAKTPLKPRWKWSSEQLHDYVLFMANTGLRPDEASHLEFRDIEIINDKDSRQTILHIKVRGKRGDGHCKSMPMAVLPFKRLQERLRTKDTDGNLCEGRQSAQEIHNQQLEKRAKGGDERAKAMLRLTREKPKPNDLVFPQFHRELFNDVLDKLKLKVDRNGHPRTAYSLRHTYICFRLLEGADIYQVAKNCRTSVEIIQNHYAIHLKNQIDAAAINVSKPGTRRRLKEAARASQEG